LAGEWRMHTREIFEHYFATRYVAAEFISQMRQGQRHSYYILKQDFAVA
jgi:hypothetical protein